MADSIYNFGDNPEPRRLSRRGSTVNPIEFEDQGALDRAMARGFVTPQTGVMRKPEAAVPAAGNTNNAPWQMPTFDPMNPYPAARRFSAVPEATPSYITDKSLHAPQEKQELAAPTRRAAPQVSSEGSYGFSAPSMGNPDDRERQAALSELKSEMFRLGSLNMRSKRELYGDMLRTKIGLTSQAFGADNERQMARARIGADAAQANASLAEAGARRRSDDAQFNAASSERRDMFETERADAKAAAAAAFAIENDPTTLKNRLLLAKENRDQQGFEAEMPAKLNAQDNAEIADLMKTDGLSREQAEDRVLQRRIVNGESVRGSRAATAAYDRQLSTVERALNDTGANMWASRGLSGDGYSPFAYGQMDPLQDLSQVEVEQLSPLNPMRLFSSRNNRVRAVGEDGKEFTTYADDETAERIRTTSGLLRRGGR